jgi:hypothetical protein
MPNETHTNLIAKLVKERDDLTTVIAVLQKRAGGSAAKGKSTGKAKRVVSAEARAAISAAQKARWAKVKKAAK